MFSLQLRSLGAVALGLAFSLAAVGAEGAQPGAKDEGAKKEAKVQTTCPVMGEKINKDIYVDHDGKRVYLCCKACIKAFNKDPEKYIKKLEDEGVTLEKVPAKDDAKSGAATCPSGKEDNADAGSGGCCR